MPGPKDMLTQFLALVKANRDGLYISLTPAKGGTPVEIEGKRTPFSGGPFIGVAHFRKDKVQLHGVKLTKAHVKQLNDLAMAHKVQIKFLLGADENEDDDAPAAAASSSSSSARPPSGHVAPENPTAPVRETRSRDQLIDLHDKAVAMAKAFGPDPKVMKALKDLRDDLDDDGPPSHFDAIGKRLKALVLELNKARPVAEAKASPEYEKLHEAFVKLRARAKASGTRQANELVRDLQVALLGTAGPDLAGARNLVRQIAALLAIPTAAPAAASPSPSPYNTVTDADLAAMAPGDDDNPG